VSFCLSLPVVATSCPVRCRKCDQITSTTIAPTCAPDPILCVTLLSDMCHDPRFGADLLCACPVLCGGSCSQQPLEVNRTRLIESLRFL
jgi:hypothetical protein